MEYDQTWIFVGVQRITAAFNSVKNCSISPRLQVLDVGSGRNRAAVKEAFAIASWCEDIAIRDFEMLD